jgi:hypothetical protein
VQASNTSLADFAVVIAENTSHVGLVVVDFSVRKSFSLPSRPIILVENVRLPRQARFKRKET